MAMDYKEAYRLLKKKFPNCRATGYTFYKNQKYVFSMPPIDLEDYGDGVDSFCYSVDKDTGEIKGFFFTNDWDGFFSSPFGRFNEEDIL